MVASLIPFDTYAYKNVIILFSTKKFTNQRGMYPIICRGLFGRSGDNEHYMGSALLGGTISPKTRVSKEAQTWASRHAQNVQDIGKYGSNSHEAKIVNPWGQICQIA